MEEFSEKPCEYTTCQCRTLQWSQHSLIIVTTSYSLMIAFINYIIAKFHKWQNKLAILYYYSYFYLLFIFLFLLVISSSSSVIYLNSWMSESIPRQVDKKSRVSHEEIGVWNSQGEVKDTPLFFPSTFLSLSHIKCFYL